MSSTRQRASHTVTGLTHHVTGVAGAVGRRAMATTGRLVLNGVGAGLQALESSRSARDTTRKYADAALQLAASTPLGKVLPIPAYPEEPQVARKADHVREAARETSARAASDTAVADRPSKPDTVTPAPPHQTTRDDAARQEAARQETARQEQLRHEQAVERATSEAAREVGAPGAATEQAEQAVEDADIPAAPEREDLPIEDFDSASLPSLRARLRSLSVADLGLLREYEQAHAHRLPIITMLDNRIAKLAADGKDAAANKNSGSTS